MKSLALRFYEELNDFLPEEKKKKKFVHIFIDRTSVKDLIESYGIPHTEIDLILVNGKSVDFSYIINDGDEISVYPEFESFDISSLQKLRPKPLRDPKFILDVHLGTLARYLRMLGFDTEYKNDFSDEEIVKISLISKRTILTKDKGILKRNEVTHGYWVRNIQPEKQLAETVRRFDLKDQLKEFTRCMECNSLLVPVNKVDILNRIPEKVKDFHNDFLICSGCGKIYWEGSHYEKMKGIIKRIIQ